MSESPDQRDSGIDGIPRSIGNPPGGTYPTDLEATLTTGTGRCLGLRPIRADDGPRLVAFHHLLSPRSVYRRYFFAHPELAKAELEHLTQVDYVNRLALIVEDGTELVAVGRYDRIPDAPDAEVAFVVADGYQGQGIGTRLLGQLAKAARRVGIVTFVASTLVENREMLDVFRHSGFPMTTNSDYGVISVQMSIASGNGSEPARW